MSSPAANRGQTTALDGSKEADKESEGLPRVNVSDKFISSGLDIVPMGSLLKVVNGNLKDCKYCKGTPLMLELHKHVAFASNWKLSCSSCDEEERSLRNSIDYLEKKADTCGDHKQRRSIKKKIYKKKERLENVRKRKNERMIYSPHLPTSGNKPTMMDYTANIRAVLASFYTGTGGLDISLMNSCQGIGGGKNWEQTFARHSPAVCDSILKVVDECFEDNLKEELALTEKETGSKRISVSFDMGWQRKGTGHTYDSNSGHAYFIGCRSGKVVRYIVYSKKCTKCDIAVAMGNEPMEHEDCPRNYKTGSSKAMEATAAYELILDLHRIGVSVEFVVSDDDSTMRATLKHVGTHKHGKLPLHVTEPSFLCNPLHRIKVMEKEVIGLALMSNSKSECQKIDAMRLKKYIGCWIGKSKLMPFDEFKALSKAPLEHLFGNHQWCSSDWCFAASLDEAIDKYSRIATTVTPTHPQPLLQAVPLSHL